MKRTIVIVMLISITATVFTQTKKSFTNAAGRPGKTNAAKAAVSDVGLVAYWKFDEGAGEKAFDFSGLSNHATIMYPGDRVPWGEGRTNFGIACTGDSMYVDAGVSPWYTFIRAFSISAWVLFDAIPNEDSNPSIVDKWDAANSRCSWFLGTVGGRIAAGVSSTGADTEGALICQAAGKVGQQMLNRWIPLVMTYDGQSLIVYSYGKEIAQGSFNTPKDLFDDSDISIFIGRSHGNDVADTTRGGNKGRRGGSVSSRSFCGTIDEVKLYNRVLTPEDMREMIKPFAADLMKARKKE